VVKNIEKIATGLGAKVVGRVPDTGGGAFGAARLAKIVEAVQARLVPRQGPRPLTGTKFSRSERARLRYGRPSGPI
jgi:hypothetical protein